MMNADFLVIGAGIAGAGAAYELSRHGRVIVLEAESQPGFHSTGRSAALFSEIYGNAPVRALSRASREFLLNPPTGFTPNALLTPRGSLYIANEEQIATFDSLQAAPDVAAHTRPLTRDEARALVPILKTEWLERAMLEPGASDVDVHALHQGYLRGMKERGATLVCASAAQSIVRERDGWRVIAGGQQYGATILVNAAGAWADEVARLAGIQPVGLEPRRRTALLIDPPGTHAITQWPMVLDVGDTFYFKPDAGKLLLSPADETPTLPSDVQPDDLDVAIAVDRFEQATDVVVRNVRHKWAGLRSFVTDRSPVIGFDPSESKFLWLVGQGGYGIQTAPAASRLAAALAAGADVPAELAEVAVAVRPDRLR